MPSEDLNVQYKNVQYIIIIKIIIYAIRGSKCSIYNKIIIIIYAIRGSKCSIYNKYN